MWSFRAYLKDKCSDPAFLEHYQDECNICPNTVMIISTIGEQGLSYEDVARRSGVALERLELLESADRCSFDDVEKLSRFLGLPVPSSCKKKSRNWDKP
jgi:hypothetical protein